MITIREGLMMYLCEGDKSTESRNIPSCIDFLRPDNATIICSMAQRILWNRKRSIES